MVTSRAAVQTADETIEIREIDVPDRIGPEEALLKVEASGMCGSDWEQYQGTLRETGIVEYPCVPGHEPIGRIEEIGNQAEETWGVSVGDRVAVEPFAPCGTCSQCISGWYQFCDNRFLYAFEPLGTGHGLWGGFSEYMVLRKNSLVHPLLEELDRNLAVLFNPLAAGYEWAYRAANLEPGHTVLILGAGQRGLASTIACDDAGAEQILVTGLSRDKKKLEIAQAFGADYTINVEANDLVDTVMELTDGVGVDRVVDTTPIATEPVTNAIEVVKPRGVIILAGIKGMREVPGFVSDKLVMNGITMKGAFGVRSWSYRRAIETIQNDSYPLEKMNSHTFTIQDVEDALRILGGETDEVATQITIVPS